MTAVLVILLCASLGGNALLAVTLRRHLRTVPPSGDPALEHRLRYQLESAEQAAASAAAGHRDELARLRGLLDQARAELDARLRQPDAGALAEAERERALARIQALEEQLHALAGNPPPGPGADSPAVPRELPLGGDSAADSVVDGADLGPLVARAASVRGDRHREDREHRRDAVHLRLVPEFGIPVLLSTVAAGSPHGEWSLSAAERGCRSLVSQLGHFAPEIGGRLFDPAADAELDGILRTAAKGVATSLRRLARERSRTGADGSTDDASVETALTAVLSRLGDSTRREHVAFGVGEGAVLRLRDGRWEHVHDSRGASAGPAVTADGNGGRVTGGGLPPALPRDPDGLSWTRFDSLPGDLVLVCSRPMADLLDRADLADWFAERWSGRRPYLTTFLSDVNVRVQSPGEDRSVVSLWDFGSARSPFDR